MSNTMLQRNLLTSKDADIVRRELAVKAESYISKISAGVRFRHDDTSISISIRIGFRVVTDRSNTIAEAVDKANSMIRERLAPRALPVVSAVQERPRYAD
jgi:hypothetical protein